MTIFFSGQTFKYELEGICKLFFPVMHFSLCCFYPIEKQEGDYIITRRALIKKNKGENEILLWVYARIDGKEAHKHYKFSEKFIKENSEKAYESECEYRLSVLLYNTLSILTGILPRWGILTGVRPVAILQKLLAGGMSEKVALSYLKEHYLVCDDKLDLALKTAQTQTKLLSDYTENSYSLYINIPFCPSRCSYCSFVSHAINQKKSTDKIDEYLSLLEKELEETAKIADRLHLILDTIYIGGGTPTALTQEQLFGVISAVARFFPVHSVREYTIEAGRADTITLKKLQLIKNAGSNMRISINPQTFNDDVLKKIGRNHTAQQAIDCFNLAKEIGFVNINADFIAGLPSDTIDSFKSSIDTAIALAPSNITVHTLSVKRNADLFESGEILKNFKEDCTSVMTSYAQKRLMESGYMPYYLYRQKNTVGNLENVGYAKAGFESLYNVYIMDEKQTILACGAGGVTKLIKKADAHDAHDAHDVPIKRIFNFKYHYEYISRFDEIIKRKQKILESGNNCDETTQPY